MNLSRNYGLDLLKIVCMFFICVHHLLLHPSNIISYKAWLINLVAYNGLYVFPIITGYVSCDSTFKVRRIIELWIQTIFYTLVITVIFYVFSRGQIWNGGLVAITPITNKTYWYLTCHIKLLLVMPIINFLLNKVKDKKFFSIIVFLLIVLLIIQDRKIYDNYLAFVVLYVIGVVIKRLDIKTALTTKFAFCILYLLGIAINYIDFFNDSYTIIFDLISAVSLLVIFKDLKIDYKLSKSIALIVPLTFGTYLIHDNPLVRKYIISKMTFISNFSGATFLIVLLFTALILYSICLFIEFLRKQLFIVLKINNFISSISEKINMIFSEIFRKKNKVIIFKVVTIVLVLIALIYLYSIMNERIDYLLDDDMSSELLLSKLIANENRFIFSRNWYYSTELRVINVQIIFAILFRLIDNWHKTRVYGSLICYVLMFCSFLYLSNKLKLNKTKYLGLALLLLPISSVYFYVVLGGLFYIPHICLSFLIIGLIISDNPLNTKVIFTLTVIGILAGFGGYRYFLVIFIPACGSTVLLSLIDYLRDKFITKKHMQLFIKSFVTSVGGVVGYLINSLFLSKYFEYGFYTSLYPQLNGLVKIKDILIGFIKDLGYIDNSGIATKYLTLFTSLLIIAFGIVSYFDILKNNKYANNHKFYALFSLINIFLFVIVNMLTNIHFEERYLILCTIFIVPNILVVIENVQKEELSVVISCILVLCFLVPSRSVYIDKKYNNTNSSLKDMVNYIVKNGYYDAYSTVSYGNMITELSNGEVRVYKFETSYDEQAKDFEDHNVWLQRIDNDTDKPKGKVCLFLRYYNPGMDDYIIYWENDDAVIYGFDSYDEMKKVIYNK